MQHSAYQPLLPSGNKYLQMKWDNASYDMHRRKVKSANATINTAPPRTYDHLALKMKKQKTEEEQMAKIQRENNILLEKISVIMRTKGHVDNRNDYESKSLGKEKRQQELIRITKENQLILLRLGQCKPHYSVRDWHKDWHKTLKLMDNIARYPRSIANDQKTQRQGKSSQTSDECDTEDSSSEAKEHSSYSSTTSGARQCAEHEEEEGPPAEEESKAKKRINEAKAQTRQAPSPAASEESPSPDRMGTPSSPEPITHTPQKASDTSSPSDLSERSNSPRTSHTSRCSTPELAAAGGDTAPEC